MYDNIIILGVLISLVFAEITNLSPAGLIVPGYILLSLKTPERAIYTLVVALLVYGLCRLLRQYIIIYGRRLFSLSIIMAFAINMALGKMGRIIPILPSVPGIVGVLVPGIMANEFHKQGIFRSICSLLIVVGILVIICQIFGVPVF